MDRIYAEEMISKKHRVTEATLNPVAVIGPQACTAAKEYQGVDVQTTW